MTEKQEIIINGVDVSGCDFLAKEDIYNSYSGVTTAYKGQCGCSDDEMCKDHRNCGYKKLARQLQRKTQECEYLEEEKADKINLLAQIIEILYPNADDAEKYSIAFNCEFIDKAKQIMQALDEIEEIASCEKIDIETNNEVWLTKYILARSCQILDIISKAKGVKS